MRRPAVLAVIAALLAATPAGALPRAAAPNAAVDDAKGDWPVSSQDIVGVRASTVYDGKRPSIQAVITLAAPPDALAQYSVAVSAHCHSWLLSARNLGGGDLQDSRMQHVQCGNGQDLTAEPETSFATVSVSGNVVTLTAPYAYGLKKGVRLESMSGGASAFFTGLWVGMDVGDQGFVMTGDLALGEVDYVLR